jgi:hypothetical protein
LQRSKRTRATALRCSANSFDMPQPQRYLKSHHHPERCRGFWPCDAPANLETLPRWQCQPGHTGAIRLRPSNQRREASPPWRGSCFPPYSHRAFCGQNPSRSRRVDGQSLSDRRLLLACTTRSPCVSILETNVGGHRSAGWTLERTVQVDAAQNGQQGSDALIFPQFLAEVWVGPSTPSSREGDTARWGSSPAEIRKRGARGAQRRKEVFPFALRPSEGEFSNSNGGC